jgi:hypothetical protein
MKKIILIMVLTLQLAGLRAQETAVPPEYRPDFIISANIAGDASLLTLGFEKLFFVKPKLTLAGKLAFGYNQDFQLFSSAPPTNYFILPHSFTLNLGEGKRSFGELGIGGAWITSNSENYYLFYPILGYRYHPFKNPGFSFRAWIYYPFGQSNTLDDSDLLIAPFGLSFGVAL